MQIKNATLTQYVKVAENGDPWVPGKFCWSGTFGRMIDNEGNFTSGLLGSSEWIYANLTCKMENLYYNQCILPGTIAIVLMVIGFIVFTVVVTVICICFGFCKCGTDDELGCCKLCKAKVPGGQYMCACLTDLDDENQALQGALVTHNALMEKSALDIEREEEEKRKAEVKFGGKKKKKRAGDGTEMPEVDNPLNAGAASPPPSSGAGNALM